MASYNKVILVGNLTRDPQLSYLPSQTAVCEIGLAVSHRWRDKDGQQREETCFIDCRSYGKQAEVLNQYMRKGRQILVEGRLQLDRWESADGQKRSKHRVSILNFQFMDGGQGRSSGAPQTQGEHQQAPPAEPEPPGNFEPAPGEDIPF